jgi:hypothetical protein
MRGRVFRIAMLVAGLGVCLEPVSARAVVIDGTFADWTTNQFAGLDSWGDVAPGDLVDWKSLWVVYQTNVLYISYETTGAVDFVGNAWRYGIYLDTDSNSSTGYRGPAGSYALGAERYIEGATVYQYTGDGTSWSWNPVGGAAYAINGARLEMSVTGSLLGMTSGSRIKILLVGNNPTTSDYARNDKAGFAYPRDRLVLDGLFLDWNSVSTLGVNTWTDGVADVSSGDLVDWRRLRAIGTNGTLYISYETRSNLDLINNAWRYDVFMDTDENNRSGYRGLSGGSGVEYLLEGGSLYAYTGSGYDWNWAFVTPLTYAVNTTRFETAVASSYLGLGTNYAIRFRLFGNNPNAVDFAPNASPGYYYNAFPAGTVTCQRMAIPAYFAPGTLWNQAIAGAPRVRIMVMNPYNGPGAAFDSGYAAAVSNAQAAGIQVMGYVYTSYGTRATNDVRNDIDTYESWYHVDGIFLDEVSPYPAQLYYYQDVDAYIQAYPGSTTILNPGVHPDEAYMGVGDIVLSFEGNYATYNNSFSLPAWAKTYPSDRFWHVVWNTTQNQMKTAIEQRSRQRNAGLVYVTNDGGTNGLNPYDTLPTPFSYWTNELNKLQGWCP